MTGIRKLDSKDDLAKSADLVARNLDALKALFPDAFTEGKVDFEELKGLLGGAVDERDEKYGLTWVGKRRARQIALMPSSGTLLPCPDESVDWETTQNLMIEGDNLEVLKLLQKSYAGKVKLIYIDPPYNTGKDFVYPDNFHDSIKNYLELTNQVDGGRKINSNIEASGRFHTEWLNMIYPRLKLARSMLRTDGLIVVSISDAESHNLRQCLDEVFGQENFIGCVIWNSTKSVTNTALISVSHTHNLIYARNKDYFVENRSHFRLPEDGGGFANPDNDPRGPWKADPFQVGGERPNQLYPITNPITGEVYRPNPGSSWKNELKVFEGLMADGRIVFGVSGEAGPQRKRFLKEAEERGKVTKTLWDDVDTTTNATRALKELMGESVFDNPKPVDLVRRFIQLGTHDPNGAIVMDFFAGSGTTGHAVMEQNAEDGGSRKFILVQLPEGFDPTDNEQKMAASFCRKNNLRLTIAELTKERLRRAGRAVAKGDTGFRVFKLASSNIRAWEPAAADLESSLLKNAEHLVQGRNEQDVLYELLLKLGLDLCVPIEAKTIAGKSVHSLGGGALIVCLADGLAKDAIEPLASGIVAWRAALAPAVDTRVVFKDSGFADDVAKTNMAAILNQNGITDVRSL